MWRRWLPGGFTRAIVLTVVLATVVPCRGAWAEGFEWLTDIAIGLLFFLHGAKLSRASIQEGISHWRLQGCILLATFVMFPVLGLLIGPLARAWLGQNLYLGLLYLCILPSTVQSSIAFVSIAGGNVAAAICAASASSLLGIVITPLWAGLLLEAQGNAGGMSWHAVAAIVVQLLLPFAAGQLLQQRIGAWVERHGKSLRLVDQGSILLVVYTAFSSAVRQGLWHQASLSALLGVLVLALLLLAAALWLTCHAARWLGFSRADEVALTFCGSKKSLATGLPLAKVLFVGHPLGLLVLPLMIFHQVQLMVCAALAQKYGRQLAADGVG